MEMLYFFYFISHFKWLVILVLVALFEVLFFAYILYASLKKGFYREKIRKIISRKNKKRIKNEVLACVVTDIRRNAKYKNDILDKYKKQVNQITKTLLKENYES